MPPLEELDRHDDAVYYRYLGEDRRGKPRLASPVDIKVRWIQGKADVMDALGNLVSVEALVVTNQDLTMHSILRQGTIADGVGTGTALDDDDVMQVSVVNKVPSLCGKYHYRSVGLTRYGSRVPG
jgi:hypothetical protein